MNVEVIIEKGDGELWGRIEGKGDFLPATVGNTVEEVLQNLRELIEDYLAHEGDEDAFWKVAAAEEVQFELLYDIQAFFAAYNEVNASAIAKRAGINPGLLRQYTSGVKHPGKEQAQKIENAIHQLANELREVSLYP